VVGIIQLTIKTTLKVITVTVVVLLTILLFLSIWNFNLNTEHDKFTIEIESLTGKDDNIMFKDGTYNSDKIPLIDQNIPLRLETATLALG